MPTTTRRPELLGRLDGMYPALHLKGDRAKAIKRHSERKGYAKLYPLSLSQLWVGLHAAIALIGFALTIAIASQA